MSWLYSQALVAAYSAGTCSDGEQSALLSGNPIPQAYCAPDRMTAFSRLSRFGMTFKPLTDALGEELLTSYLAGFLAKTSVQQDAEPGLMERNPACGNTWRESLGRYDRDTHTLKTAQCSLFEDSTLSSPTLPRWGLMRSGELFRQQTLVPPIAETESGLLPARSYLIPTPTASPDAPNHGSNSHGPHNLLEVAQTGWKPGMMWPTPTSTLGTNGGQVTPSKGREGGTLIEALSARTLWPTPCANETGENPEKLIERMKKYGRTGSAVHMKLSTKVQMWPTPTAHNAKETNAPSESNLHTPTLAAQAGGALNPTWVEWLMGWPLGWTDLKPLEMDKYQQWLQQHGVY
jgi:DNA (cytosine-5)-methyltransferase 1